MINKPPKIFLSHSRKDKKFVSDLAERLMLDGFNVWYDDWEIKIGESIVQNISEGISTSDFLIIVLSSNSVESKWVKEELNSATVTNIEKNGVFILPILIENCRIPQLLKDKKYANFSEGTEGGYKTLIDALRTHCVGGYPHLTGDWVGDTGNLRIDQDDGKIFGQYCYNSEKYRGKIFGNIINKNFLKIKWQWISDPHKNGFGYFFILNEDNELHGGWWLSNLDFHVDEAKITQLSNLSKHTLIDLNVNIHEHVISSSIPDNRLRSKIIHNWQFRRESHY